MTFFLNVDNGGHYFWHIKSGTIQREMPLWPKELKTPLLPPTRWAIPNDTLLHLSFNGFHLLTVPYRVTAPAACSRLLSTPSTTTTQSRMAAASTEVATMAVHRSWTRPLHEVRPATTLIPIRRTKSGKIWNTSECGWFLTWSCLETSCQDHSHGNGRRSHVSSILLERRLPIVYCFHIESHSQGNVFRTNDMSSTIRAVFNLSLPFLADDAATRWNRRPTSPSDSPWDPWVGWRLPRRISRRSARQKL